MGAAGIPQFSVRRGLKTETMERVFLCKRGTASSLMLGSVIIFTGKTGLLSSGAGQDLDQDRKHCIRYTTLRHSPLNKA